MNKRRLGRGLAALLGTEEGGFDPVSLDSAELLHIPVDQIDPNPFQPRREFDRAELTALADSLRQHGMLQPILVRSAGERYQLIAGERRLRAAIEAQLHEVPTRVMELDDQRISEFAMIENLQREDLNAIEKAAAFRNYLDSFGGTQEELAGRLGLERSTVTNLLRLLELPNEVQDAVRSKKISQGHARALLGLDESANQVEACARIVTENLSVRQTEALVSTGEPTPARTRIRKDQAHADATPATGRAPHVLELEEQLKQRFGTVVAVRVKGPSRGQFIIDFNNNEEYDRVAGMLRGW